jgi:hypothetical protein
MVKKTDKNLRDALLSIENQTTYMVDTVNYTMALRISTADVIHKLYYRKRWQNDDE